MMTARTLFVVAALLLSATSATLAQDNGYGVPYGYGAYDVPGYSIYDYAPGYSYYGGGYYGSGYHESERGGPGPRVGSGQGMGAGSQR
jgi:hypothetical protein